MRNMLKKSFSSMYLSPNEFGEQPCPHCGGTDRFWISNFNGELKHHCRQGCHDLERLTAMQRDGVLPEATPSTVETYHQRKNIPLVGAKLECDIVVVPLFDVLTGEQKGQQEIFPDGREKFSKGMKKLNSGCFIGEPSKVLFVAEGWATAVAVHLATKQQALFALDAKTLVKTAKNLNHSNVKIAADNDPESLADARATHLTWSKPKDKNCDWWDVYHYEGKQALIDQIRDYNEPSKPDNPFDRISITNGIELTNKQFKELSWLKDGFFPFLTLF